MKDKITNAFCVSTMNGCTERTEGEKALIYAVHSSPSGLFLNSFIQIRRSPEKGGAFGNNRARRIKHIGW